MAAPSSGPLSRWQAAAGVALFVALMSSQTAALVGTGVEPVAALSAGIRTAFLCGAIISLFAVVTAFFVRKPADQPGGFHGGH